MKFRDKLTRHNLNGRTEIVAISIAIPILIYHLTYNSTGEELIDTAFPVVAGLIGGIGIGTMLLFERKNSNRTPEWIFYQLLLLTSSIVTVLISISPFL